MKSESVPIEGNAEGFGEQEENHSRAEEERQQVEDIITNLDDVLFEKPGGELDPDLAERFTNLIRHEALTAPDLLRIYRSSSAILSKLDKQGEASDSPPYKIIHHINEAAERHLKEVNLGSI